MTPSRAAVRELVIASLRERSAELGHLVAWSIVEALPAYLSGRLVARALDEGFLVGRAEIGLAWLGVFAAAVVIGAFGTRQTYLRLAAIVEPFRDDLVTRVVTGALRRSTIPGSLTDGAAVARMTQQVEIAREAYASLLMVVQGFLVTTLSALVGLSTLVPAALILVVPPLVLAVGLSAVALGRTAALQRESLLADERVAEAAGELANGLRDVVACGAEERVAAAVGNHIDAQATATRRLARLAAVQTLAVAIGGWLPVVLILAGASWLIARGATEGAILGALTYVLHGVHPALQTMVRGLANAGLWLFTALMRIIETTDVAESADVGAGMYVAKGSRPRHCDLELQNVTFAYGRRAEPVIRGLDLVVPDGDHLAIIGPSGVGKSTLAGLACGLLTPQEGQVTIAGVALRDRDPATLAGLRVLIPQQAYVFAGSVRENLSYLRPSATDAELDRAVAELGVASLLERLGGYDADLRPSELSAGERQLVTLTRAYLSPARLVVLDEATCHVDPETEARIERAFARRPGALIVIAHRISSADRARRILLLDGDRVLLGAHDDLLERSALYRDLVGHWQPAPRECRVAS